MSVRTAFWLGIRSLLWVTLLPGMVAGFLPWRYFGLGTTELHASDPLHWAALGVILAGAASLALCIWEFAHRGRGTLSPIDPPTELVVYGLYRYVRNPMYLSVATILIGELLLIRSTEFLGYFVLWVVAVNLFVMAYEEPWLRRHFGESYGRYAAQVGRWLPSLRHPYVSR